MKKPPTTIIFIGIPASGKTTFYKSTFADEYVHINLDTLHTRNKELILIDACIAEGKSFAIDNTNPTKADRQRYIPKAKAAGYRITGYFFQSKIADCIERNDQREGKTKIPNAAIGAISAKMEMPSLDEGFDELYFVSIENHAFTISEWKENHI